MEISREPASLYVLVNRENGNPYRLIKGKNLAGRCPREMVHISLRAIVASRQHAEVLVNDDNTVSIYDVGSGNGTFLNGRRIEPHVPASVLVHDEIGFGVGNTPINELSDDQILPMFELQMQPLSPPPTPPTLDSAAPTTVADPPPTANDREEDVDNSAEEAEMEDDNYDESDDCEMHDDGCSTVQDNPTKDHGETRTPSAEENLTLPPALTSHAIAATSNNSASATTNLDATSTSSEAITHQDKVTDSRTITADNQSTSLLPVDCSRIKTEDCIIEIEDDEDEDTILSQAAFAPATSVPEAIPESTFVEIKRELDDLGLGTPRYIPTIDLTDDVDNQLDWLNDFNEFETAVENNAEEAEVENTVDCDRNNEQTPIPVETVEDTPADVKEATLEEPAEAMDSDSDSDVVQQPVRRSNKRRYGQLSDSESESENDPKSDTNSVKELIQKYCPQPIASCSNKESTSSTKTIQQLEESSDDDSDNDHEPQPKGLPADGPPFKKLKAGSNYVESRMDTKGIQIELAKRHKINKRKSKSVIRPVTNIDLLDKRRRENIVKERRERLKSLSSVHAEEVEKKDEEVKAGTSKGVDKLQKVTAKVKMSNGRGAFLCDAVDNIGSAAARPPSKYTKPTVIEPHYINKKVRIAHNSAKSASATHTNIEQSTVDHFETSAMSRPSTSTARTPPTDDNARYLPYRHTLPPPLLPVYQTTIRQPSPTTTIAIHPTVACMLNWPSRSFYDYLNNPRSAGVPGLNAGVRVETLPHTRTWYESYEQYKTVMQPLMEIELWMSVYADWCKVGRIPFWFRAKIDYIDMRSNYTSITCKAYVNSRDANNAGLRKNSLFIVSFQIIDPENTQKRSFLQLVTYIHTLDKRPICPFDNIPPGVTEGRVDFVIHLTLLSKSISSTIDSQKLIKCDFISYVLNTVKLFDAVDYLKHSALRNIILNPTIEDYDISNFVNYDTPMYSEVLLNESQRRAVLEATYACSRPEPRLYLIEGPPGTGKTTVITQLLRQLLFHRKSKKQVRILLVAPSNGAVDNLMRKILDIKRRLTKDQLYAFKLIRVGSLSQIHPDVVRYSIEDYASKSLSFTLCKNNPAYSEEYSKLMEQFNSLRQHQESKDPTLRTAFHTAAYKLDDFARIKLGQNFHHQLAKEKCMIINHCHIICTTLSSCFRLSKSGDLPLKVPITCCIVDEATQSVEQDTLIPLLLNVDKMVLVGDPQQLPAVTSSSIARTCGYGQSLFTRIKMRLTEQATMRHESLTLNDNIIRFLDTQYRMHPHISLFPNYAFYNGRLKDAAHLTHTTPRTRPPSIAQTFYHPSTLQQHSSLQLPAPNPNVYPCSSSAAIQQRPCPAALRALRPYMVIRQSERELFPSQQYGNQSEVELVVGLYNEIGKVVREARDNRNRDVLTVGIITPYNRQKEMIENGVKQLIGINEGLNLTVTTVDGVQGQEKDIVIISNVRMHGNSFVENENRLNVALTRAKHVLYIVGSDNLFENSRLFREIERDAISRKLQATIPNSGSVRDVIRIPD